MKKRNFFLHESFSIDPNYMPNWKKITLKNSFNKKFNRDSMVKLSNIVIDMLYFC
jgi:hypothetical protein